MAHPQDPLREPPKQERRARRHGLPPQESVPVPKPPQSRRPPCPGSCQHLHLQPAQQIITQQIPCCQISMPRSKRCTPSDLKRADCPKEMSKCPITDLLTVVTTCYAAFRIFLWAKSTLSSESTSHHSDTPADMIIESQF